MRLPFFLLAAAAVLGCEGAPSGASRAPETATVIVARTNVPTSCVVEEPERLFKKVRYLKGDEPSEAFTSFDRLKGMTILRPLAEDQPIKQQDVTDVPIPNGLSAITVALDPESIPPFNGFLPGNHVDVVVVPPPGHSAAQLQLVASYVLLLQWECSISHQPETGFVHTATLALKPEDRNRLPEASKIGPIRILLCTPQENK